MSDGPRPIAGTRKINEKGNWMENNDVNFDGLKKLFRPGTPNRPILFAALDQKTRSTVVADDPAEPRMAALRTPDGVTFFSPDADEAFVRGSLRKLQLTGPLMAILCEPDGRFPKPDIVIPRYEFLGRSAADTVKETQIPPGFSLHPLDENLFAGCEWRALIEMSYGSMGDFFASGYGYLLMEGEQIVTETYAAFIGAGAVEIGVITAEAFRGRGYATIAAAHLVRRIEESGLQPYWSCDQSNAGSLAVAKKLGFKDRRNYAIYGYRPLKVPEI